MKKFKFFRFILLFVIWCFEFGAFSPAAALYDPRSVPNNKVGVHILNPSEVNLAASLVNAGGGDWGYVTVPIQPTDRDTDKWQKFMTDCTTLHLIPIVRITTIPQGGTWDKAKDTDLVDFANFLNNLSWPVENRYIVLFNEVNRSTEWGDAVEPNRYAAIVRNAREIFKERSSDFFLLGPALDDSLPDSATSMSAKRYLQQLMLADPAIWSYFDGYATHSYPNPGFATPPNTRGSLPGTTSYRYLFTAFKLADKPVFVTETGWDQAKIKGDLLRSYWQSAWQTWQDDSRVAAVTPFVLQGGDQFAPFSLYNPDASVSTSGDELKSVAKVMGSPHPGSKTTIKQGDTSHTSAGSQFNWKASRSLLKLENIFRVILGLPSKGLATLGDQTLLLELAQTPAQWEKGLADRSELGGIDGMLFLFPNYHIPVFWMKDTRIPLDMIWLKDDIIMEITPDIPVSTSQTLPTYSPQVPVDSVLELPAGFCAAHNLQPGDKLIIDP